MATLKRIGRILPSTAALFLCDMQDKFRTSIKYFPQIVEVSNRMLKGAKVLNMPVVITEQYPKGLGHTVSEFDIGGCPVFPKTQFSMMIPEVVEHLKKHPDVKSVLLCGIEAQACVLQTVLDLIERDFDVHVVADAVSARTMVDRMFALERMKEAGAYIATSDALLFMLCRDAASPNFKQIQKIIWDPAPDSGLLGSRELGGTPV